MSASTADFLGGYRPPRTSVRVTQRADLLARHADLHRALKVAIRGDMETNEPDRAPGIRDEIKTVETEIADSEFEFTFESIGRQKYLKLLGDHPPRAEDREDGLHFNGDEFPPALISAAAAEPTISADEAAQLIERLSDGQFTKMWNAALTVNIGSDDAPKSVLRSDTAAQRETSSTTASPEESPEASLRDA